MFGSISYSDIWLGRCQCNRHCGALYQRRNGEKNRGICKFTCQILVLVLQNTSRVLLWLLILAGLWGALGVSYTTITGTARCPDIVDIPICYLVGLGYLSMLAAQVVAPAKLKNRLFYPGWAIVFLVAVLGTGFELSIGDACPRSGSGVPLCYFSILLSIAIILFYRFSVRTPE